MPQAPTPPELQQLGLSGAELTAALRIFFRIAHEWQLDSADAAVLLGVGASTAQAWHYGAWDQPPTGDTAVRLAYLLNIYLSLQLLSRLTPRRTNGCIGATEQGASSVPQLVSGCSEAASEI